MRDPQIDRQRAFKTELVSRARTDDGGMATVARLLDNMAILGIDEHHLGTTAGEFKRAASIAQPDGMRIIRRAPSRGSLEKLRSWDRDKWSKWCAKQTRKGKKLRSGREYIDTELLNST